MRRVVFFRRRIPPSSPQRDSNVPAGPIGRLRIEASYSRKSEISVAFPPEAAHIPHERRTKLVLREPTYRISSRYYGTPRPYASESFRRRARGGSVAMAASLAVIRARNAYTISFRDEMHRSEHFTKRPNRLDINKTVLRYANLYWGIRFFSGAARAVSPRRRNYYIDRHFPHFLSPSEKSFCAPKIRRYLRLLGKVCTYCIKC